jgi:hypothetical protein
MAILFVNVLNSVEDHGSPLAYYTVSTMINLVPFIGGDQVVSYSLKQYQYRYKCNLLVVVCFEFPAAELIRNEQICHETYSIFLPLCNDRYKCAGVVLQFLDIHMLIPNLPFHYMNKFNFII